jgi:negative regulator of sigma E activity
MANETKTEASKPALKTRRAFVTTAAQVAVTAPAVAMLLSATTKPAAAQTRPYNASNLNAFDDGTGPGNDVCTGGTNADATFGCVN